MPVDREEALVLPSGALVCRGDSPIRVNGRAVPGGLRVLREKDEIRLARHRFYFSTKDALTIARHEGEPTTCPRCTEPIKSGADAIRCHCGTLFHQSEDHPCYTYGETCPSCGVTTRIDGSPWNPSEL
ncbi:hypothetical protein [Haloferula sp. A504]|uniref:hypothetical protein n=1 Tax=Haloferula sp. A504 TaxID=3373601 RepID=UPI0031CAD7AC|nr:hypothetical protein [Verrucomicrobiaceae bacterium E54]